MALTLVPLLSIWSMSFVGIVAVTLDRDSTSTSLISELPNDFVLQAERGCITLAFPQTDPFSPYDGLSTSFVRYDELDTLESIYLQRPSLVSGLVGSFALGELGRREPHDPYLMADWLITLPLWLPVVLVAAIGTWALRREHVRCRDRTAELALEQMKPNKSR